MRSWRTRALLLNFYNSLGRRCEKDYTSVERYKIGSSPCSSASTCAQSMINKKTLLTLLYTMCQGAQYDSSRREAKLSKAGWLIAMMALTVLLQPRSIKPEVRPYALLVDYNYKNQACAQDLMSLSSYIQQQCEVNTD